MRGNRIASSPVTENAVLNLVLSLVRFEIVGQRGNQLHLVIVEWAQVENHLPGFLDCQFQLGFRFADRGQAGLGILAEQFLGELQLEIDAGETLHQPVMYFAGNASPFFRDGGARFFDVQSIKGLIFVQGLFDVGRRADAGLDQAAT